MLPSSRTSADVSELDDGLVEHPSNVRQRLGSSLLLAISGSNFRLLSD